MEREELAKAAEALLDDAPLAHAAYVSQERREEWMKQLTTLLEDVLSNTDAWGLLPPIDRDVPPSGGDSLGMTLCFVDAAALYRVIPFSSDANLTIRVERTPFSTLHVILADNRSFDRLSRSWQFLNEDETFNLSGHEGPNSTEFLHELARRTGWRVR